MSGGGGVRSAVSLQQKLTTEFRSGCDVLQGEALQMLHTDRKDLSSCSLLRVTLVKLVKPSSRACSGG
eukprot:1137065-Pelagomonas_calceolata.AAC.8